MTQTTKKPRLQIWVTFTQAPTSLSQQMSAKITEHFFIDQQWHWQAHRVNFQDSESDYEELEVYFRQHHHHDRLSWSGIFKRAWYFQERLLSPRVARFTKNEVVFKCNQRLVCECGEVPKPPLTPQVPDRMPGNDMSHDKKNFQAHAIGKFWLFLHLLVAPTG
jgi:hypothetical protein